jgi:ribosomal protein S18 acetylase RimI-like enzyme
MASDPVPASAPVEVRPARTEEYAAVGALTARVYVEAGLVPTDSPYLADLRAAAERATSAQLLVACAAGRLAGSVTFALPGSRWAELAGPDEAEFRMLVVDAAARGAGIGTRLVVECLDRARAAGARAVVLSTQPQMRAAHAIYERLAFRREPARDWSPAPGVGLLAYRRDL